MKGLPKDFIESLSHLEFIDSDELINSLDTPAPTSIRINPEKWTQEQTLEKVPWSKYGYYLKERPSFYADPSHHSGEYYVQEASSMVIEHIINQIEFEESPLHFLDMCAAPGGKSTILSNFLNSKGLLLSNELVWKRNLILQENIERWGNSNTIITHNSSGDFRKVKNAFDLVLVDAPCSGEGMFRKDPRVREEWSLMAVDRCVEMQREILEDLAASIKYNGYLIYSTCTYNLKENEDQINNFIDDYDFETLEINGLEEHGVIKNQSGNATFYRFFPNKIKGEGLCVCLLKKKSEESGKNKTKGDSQIIPFKQNTEVLRDFIELDSSLSIWTKENTLYALDEFSGNQLIDKIRALRIIRAGTEIGIIKHNKLIPSHALALSKIWKKDIQIMELNEQDSLRLLKKDASFFNSDISANSWILLAYKGNGLAFGKIVNGRLNIHLPKNFRIRKNIDDFLV